MMNMENILAIAELSEVTGGGLVYEGHHSVMKQLKSALKNRRLKDKAESMELHGPLEAIEAAEAEVRAKHTEHATKNIYRNFIKG